MEKEGTGCGGQAPVAPQTLHPLRPWTPAPGPSRPQTPCVHTQADSQQWQKEQRPLAPVHSATALCSDRGGTAAPQDWERGMQTLGLM